MVGVLGMVVVVLAGLVFVKWSEDPGWSRHDLSDPFALVADGDRVCATQGAQLLCVEADSGDDIFTVDLPGEATPVALAEGTLVVGAEGGVGHADVYGYSLDGDLLWEATDVQEVDIESVRSIGNPFTVAGGVVIVPLGDDGLDGIVALDTASGDELWRVDESSRTDLTIGGGLASDGQRFYADLLVSDEFDVHSGVAALDPATGDLLWQLDLAGPAADVASGLFVYNAVVIDEDSSVALGLYGGDDAETFVVDVATGQVRWQVPLQSEWGGLAHLDGVTVVSDGSTVIGFNQAGAEIWSSELPAAESTESTDDAAFSPDLAVAGGQVCVLDFDLVSVDPTDGAIDVLMADQAPTAVVAADGYLVVGGPGGWRAVPLDAG